jgi:hypothetical protein
MKPEDVTDLTIAELEDLFDGFAECNKDTTKESQSKTLTDFDAIKHLIANKDIF